jgi:hypothetical protein
MRAPESGNGLGGVEGGGGIGAGVGFATGCVFDGEIAGVVVALVLVAIGTMLLGACETVVVYHVITKPPKSNKSNNKSPALRMTTDIY